MKAWDARTNERGDFDKFGLPYFGRWASLRSWLSALWSLLRRRPTAYRIAILPAAHERVGIVMLSFDPGHFSECIFGGGVSLANGALVHGKDGAVLGALTREGRGRVSFTASGIALIEAPREKKR